MKHLFNKTMTSSQARAGFLIEAQRLKQDYQEVMDEILKREAPPEGTLWLTEEEIPLGAEELRREYELGHKVPILLIDPYMGHYGEIIEARLGMTENRGVVAIVGSGEEEDCIFEDEYNKSWIAFRGS